MGVQNQTLKQPHQRLPHLWLRFFFWIVFTLVFLSRVHSPGLADDVDFIVPLKKWVTDGPQRIGFWHTPFYPWILSLLGRWFHGLTPTVARIPGFLCVTGAVYFQLKTFDRTSSSYLSAQEKPEESEKHEIQKTFLCFILLFSPLTFASALILDYDNTLLLLGTSIWFYCLSIFSTRSRSFFILTAALCFCFMGKETTPFVYPLALWVLSGSFFYSFSVGALGLFLFLGVTWIWCLVYALPLSATFEMALLGLQKSKDIQSVQTWESIGRTLWMKISPFLWVGLPLLSLILIRVKKLKPTRNVVSAVFSVILITVFVYTFALKQMTYHFPKYMSPVFFWLPFVALRLNPWMNLGELSIPTSRKNTLIALLAVFLWALFGPNPLDILYLRNFMGVCIWLAYFGIPIFIWGVLRFLFKKIKLPLTSFMWILQIAFCLTSLRVSLFQKGSIAYWYGDQAVQETEEWLRNSPLTRLPQVRLIAPAKDIAAAFADRLEFLPIDQIAPSSEALCQEKRPLIILTRRREDTSLLTLHDFHKIRNCVTLEHVGKDLIIGYRIPAQ